MRALRVTGRAGPVDAVIRVPGSKSVANRALVCAALAGSGESRITNVPGGDDCAAMLGALRDAGCVGDDGVVRGGRFPGASGRFDASIAGTTSRFLTAVAALSRTGVVVDGGEPLRRRPMGDLHDALSSLGATVEPLGERGHLPVRVSRGSLAGGSVTVRGDVSSQFLSALMLVAPCLDGGLVITVRGDLVSRPYIEMTAAVMRSFGADVTVGVSEVVVRPVPYAATDYVVEPDFSSAAFPVMALSCVEGRVTIPGLARATLQGDSFVLEVARRMGMEVGVNGDDIQVVRAPETVLRPVDVDLRDASDLVPAVAVACTAIPGRSVLSGVGFIRSKESDRLSDLASELNASGATVAVFDDGLVIDGGARPSGEPSFATHHDHRLAMSFSLLAGGGRTCIIEDPDTVSKSWPSFFLDMEGLLHADDSLK